MFETLVVGLLVGIFIVLTGPEREKQRQKQAENRRLKAEADATVERNQIASAEFERKEARRIQARLERVERLLAKGGLSSWRKADLEAEQAELRCRRTRPLGRGQI